MVAIQLASGRGKGRVQWGAMRDMAGHMPKPVHAMPSHVEPLRALDVVDVIVGIAGVHAYARQAFNHNYTSPTILKTTQILQ